MRKLLVVVPILFAAPSAGDAQRTARLVEELRLDPTKEDFPRVGGVSR